MIGAKGRKKRRRKKKEEEEEAGRGERYNADQLRGRRKKEAAIARGTNRARILLRSKIAIYEIVRSKTYAPSFFDFSSISIASKRKDIGTIVSKPTLKDNNHRIAIRCVRFSS